MATGSQSTAVTAKRSSFCDVGTYFASVAGKVGFTQGMVTLAFALYVAKTWAKLVKNETEDQALRHNQQLRPLSEAFPKVAGLRGPALIIPVTTPCLTIKTRAWQQTVVAQIYLIPQLIDWIVMGHPRHRSGKRQLACLVVSPLAHRRTGNPTYRWLRGRPRHCFKTLPSLKVVTRLLTQYHELSLRKL
jgi:hypothetical protein